MRMGSGVGVRLVWVRWGGGGVGWMGKGRDEVGWVARGCSGGGMGGPGEG